MSALVRIPSARDNRVLALARDAPDIGARHESLYSGDNALTTFPQLLQQHLSQRILHSEKTTALKGQFKMVHKLLFWSGFGVAARLWQLGIERRPLFNKESLWVYPVYATIGGSFGYWLTGVEQRQFRLLADRRDALLEKRARRKEREETAGSA